RYSTARVSERRTHRSAARLRARYWANLVWFDLLQPQPAQFYRDVLYLVLGNFLRGVDFKHYIHRLAGLERSSFDSRNRQLDGLRNDLVFEVEHLPDQFDAGQLPGAPVGQLRSRFKLPHPDHIGINHLTFGIDFHRDFILVSVEFRRTGPSQVFNFFVSG